MATKDSFLLDIRKFKLGWGWRFSINDNIIAQCTDYYDSYEECYEIAKIVLLNSWDVN